MNLPALARALALSLAAPLCHGADGIQNAAPIPFKQEAALGVTALPGGALGVLLLSMLAIGAVYVVRKRLKLVGAKADGAPRRLRIVETQRLGPRTLLSVVEFAGGEYLIAQSEQGVCCLATAPKEPA